MGISAGGAKGGPKHDINITPLIDVVLVLLIIFLVTTPIMMRQITIEVPRKLDEEEQQKVVVASKQVSVLIRADGTVTVSVDNEDTQINRVELASTLRPILEEKRGEKVVFVDFQDAVMYGDAVSAMDTIKGAGAEKVALKIREEDGQPGP